MTSVSLIDRFKAAVQAFGDAPAVLESERQLTFSEFDAQSDRVAAGLSAQGIKPGDRVALYCINSAEFALAYVGIVKVGAVVVPVNLLQRPGEIAVNLNDAQVKGLLHHHAFSTNVPEIQSLVPSLEFSVCISGEVPFAQNWSALVDHEGPVPSPEIDPDCDLAVILYTSGTTGKPKGAMLTHANLVTNTRSVFEAMKWQPANDRVLLVLPMFHAFAATVGMLTPLTHGCALIPLPKFEPDLVVNAISEHQASLFLGVPSMYGLLLRVKPEQVEKFTSLRACVSGGASMPVEVMRQFEEKFNLKIYEGDGPTECSPVTCVNPFDGVCKPGTVGLPVPGVEMSIVDDAGQPLPVGEIGEIAVRGKSVMKGYWGLPEETQQSFSGEWFLTGDLGSRDEEGYFSIIDRKKDMVIVNGMNVYPRMIEEVLYRFEPILEAAVVGQPDRRHGEIPVAYVALKPGHETDVSAVKAWCRQHLGSYEVPRKVEIVEALPKNAAGKIMKRELRLAGEVERGIE